MITPVPEGRLTMATGLRAETGANGPLMLGRRKVADDDRLVWERCQASLREAGASIA